MATKVTLKRRLLRLQDVLSEYPDAMADPELRYEAAAKCLSLAETLVPNGFKHLLTHAQMWRPTSILGSPYAVKHQAAFRNASNDVDRFVRLMVYGMIGSALNNEVIWKNQALPEAHQRALLEYDAGWYAVHTQFFTDETALTRMRQKHPGIESMVSVLQALYQHHEDLYRETVNWMASSPGPDVDVQLPDLDHD